MYVSVWIWAETSNTWSFPVILQDTLSVKLNYPMAAVTYLFGFSSYGVHFSQWCVDRCLGQGLHCRAQWPWWPPCFWEECCFLSCYLLLHLPSNEINWQSAYICGVCDHAYGTCITVHVDVMATSLYKVNCSHFLTRKIPNYIRRPQSFNSTLIGHCQKYHKNILFALQNFA